MHFWLCSHSRQAAASGIDCTVAHQILGCVTVRKVCALVSLLVAASASYIVYQALLRSPSTFGNHLFGLSFHERNALGFPALGNLLRQNTPSIDARAGKGAEERICVIMSDNRPLLQLQPRMKATEIPYYQMTVYYNLLYALRHGYCFRRINASPDEGYHGTWPKIQVMLEQLNATDHDMLVYLDGDAYITDTAVPFSRLLAIAGFKSTHSLMMAQDPDEEVNYNIHGQRNLNTGFIVARNNNVTRSIFSDILTCPERLEACEHLKRDWPHEQGAFSSYVMPTVSSQDLLQADCDLFNGYSTQPYCTGRYVSHAWSGKHLLSEILIDEVLQAMLHALETSLLSHHSIS